MPRITPPTRTGYIFQGYYDTNAASGGTRYYNADGTSARTWDKTFNMTLYARWTPTYTVYLIDPKDGTGYTVNATYDSNMPTIIPPTRLGYAFEGYFYSSTTSGETKYYNANGASARKWDIANNVTLYAKWAQKDYTIRYHANGGYGAPEPQEKTYGEDITLSAVRPEKENAFFRGWATSPDSTTVAYRPGDSFAVDADTVLYAVYGHVNLDMTPAGTASTDGIIQNPGDVNVFKITAPRSDTYQIYTSSLTGGTAINVYNARAELVSHSLSYYNLTGGQAYYVELVNQTSGVSVYSLHIDMSTESHYYMNSIEGPIWYANSLISDHREDRTLFKIDKAGAEGYTISADRMYDYYDHSIITQLSSPQYLTYTPSTLTVPNSQGEIVHMAPYDGTGGQRWNIQPLPGNHEYFVQSTEGTLSQLLILNTEMPRPYSVNRTAYSSRNEARFTFSSRIDMPVEDGSYRLMNPYSNLYMSVSGSDIIQNDDQYIWDIERQADGFYKIYQHSEPNKVLTYDGNTIVSAADTNRYDQMWKIAKCADGTLRIFPAGSSQIISVPSALTYAKASLQNDGFDTKGKWVLSVAVTDGVYEIQGKTSGKLIHAAHTGNGAAAHLWQSAETVHQKMRFELLDDGAYRITMLSGDNRVLTNPNSTVNGTGLQFNDWTGEDHQRWYVVDLGDGFVKLINKYSGLAVDISENGTANGTKIQQWTDAGADAQRFKLIRTKLPYTSIYLNDGTYEIQSKTSGKLIHAANWTNGSAAHLWEPADINLQKMHFERQNDGTYRITVLSGNGGALTNPESYDNGSGLQFSAWTGRDHQKWYVVSLSDGYIKLINKYSGMAIDVFENLTGNGTKIQQWKDGNTNTQETEAQKFRLLPTDLPYASMELVNGIYEMQASTSRKLLHAADWTDGSKAHLWESVENNPLQKMRFERQNDGTYKITVLATGYALTNPYSYVNGTGLQFTSWIDGDHQKWYVVDRGDGFVKLINKYSGLAIDISENGSANGTKTQQWKDENVSAQDFRLIPA